MGVQGVLEEDNLAYRCSQAGRAGRRGAEGRSAGTFRPRYRRPSLQNNDQNRSLRMPQGVFGPKRGEKSSNGLQARAAKPLGPSRSLEDACEPYCSLILRSGSRMPPNHDALYKLYAHFSSPKAVYSFRARDAQARDHQNYQTMWSRLSGSHIKQRARNTMTQCISNHMYKG